MEIHHLTKEFVIENIKDLVELDHSIMDDPWNADSFLVDLDGKWIHSMVLLHHEEIIGYLICSLKDGSLHIHRFGIMHKCQNQKIGSEFLSHFLNSCTKSKINIVTLNVKKSNQLAQNFYDGHYFKKFGEDRTKFYYKRVV